jgi:hypothetical protein
MFGRKFKFIVLKRQQPPGRPHGALKLSRDDLSVGNRNPGQDSQIDDGVTNRL